MIDNRLGNGADAILQRRAVFQQFQHIAGDGLVNVIGPRGRHRDGWGFLARKGEIHLILPHNRVAEGEGHVGIDFGDDERVSGQHWWACSRP